MVIPILNKEGSLVIGASGRSILDQCKKCEMYHINSCPNDKFQPQYSKWRHSKGFNAENSLFNYWFAKESIKENKSAILVEGPLDCMKLTQAGINNSLGLFGINLTDQQTITLEASGAHIIHLMLDKDKAGEQGILNIKNRLNKIFKLNIINFGTISPANMSIEEIKRIKL